MIAATRPDGCVVHFAADCDACGVRDPELFHAHDIENDDYGPDGFQYRCAACGDEWPIGDEPPLVPFETVLPRPVQAPVRSAQAVAS